MLLLLFYFRKFFCVRLIKTLVPLFYFPKFVAASSALVQFPHFLAVVFNFASIHGDELRTMQQCGRKQALTRRNGERSAFQASVCAKSSVAKR